jgi:vancomycin resistance protein YoaR
MKVNYDGTDFFFTAGELGLYFDIENTLERACYSETEGQTGIFGGLSAVFYPREAVWAQTALCYDKETVTAALEKKLSGHDTLPADARVSFDKEAGAFLISPDRPGRKADIGQTADEIINRLLANDLTEINAEFAAQNADVKTEDLEYITAVIGEYTAEASKSESENANLSLICSLADGCIVGPGETFSLNRLMVEPDDSAYAEDVKGGGADLFAGALYNAALLAGMEIAERSCHPLPDHLPLGLDADFILNEKNLKIKNSSDYPIYISASLDTASKTITVRLFGEPSADGEIEIVTEITEIAPKTDLIVYTEDLPPCETEITVPSRIGYDVKVYRNFLINGELERVELISNDIYEPVRGTVSVGANVSPADAK